MTKRIVHYNKNKYVFIEVGKSAEVYAIDHYNKYDVHPHQRVVTSVVLWHNTETGVFETENSTYVPDVVEGVY